ncbi:hypothetical protein [Flavobacterium sp. GCM10023249]|uniref:hypothetical protein n=1 Tax=unclassified Flavobacterium TaxID=196869 RepID=UPI0036063587
MENNKKGVGRKPKIDKKVTINLYVLQSVVDEFGDGYALRDFLYKSIEEKINGVPDLDQIDDKKFLAEMLHWWKTEQRNKVIDDILGPNNNGNEDVAKKRNDTIDDILE